MISKLTTIKWSSRKYGPGIRMKEKHIDKWSKSESTEIKPGVYGQVNFDKDVKTAQEGKESLTNKWHKENYMQKMKWDS